jgi:tRNA/rRNA methyltransferase
MNDTRFILINTSHPGNVGAAAPAAASDVQGLLDHWKQALTDVGFLDPAAPKKLMPRLNQLFNRAELTVEEIHILRGIARAMQGARKP